MKPAASLARLLVFAAATHLLVDTTAGLLNPLWPRLNAHYALVGWQSAAIFFLWQTTTSVSQFAFGLYGDRFNARWLLWAGPLAAILALGCIGLTNSPLMLAQLLIIAGLGIAAYHPEAAALAGSAAPEHRSRAMSIFTMAGFIGQAIGPILSGNLVDRLGMAGMAWTTAGGLALALVVAPLGRGALQTAHRAAGPPVSLARLFTGRTKSLLLILIIGSLRIVAAGGVPVLIGFLLAQRRASGAETGIVQAAFMAGVGLGGLLCATLLRRHHERLIIWSCPLLVAPVLVAIPHLHGVVLSVTVGVSGLLLGISLPVLISYGQQLMPDSQRIASSITMGVSWGVGGAAVSVVQAACEYTGRYEGAFYVFSITAAASSALCIWLPVLPALGDAAAAPSTGDALAA
jgi:FSR family fosmidomycin resistance protein-like MFS transporter